MPSDERFYRIREFPSGARPEGKILQRGREDNAVSGSNFDRNAAYQQPHVDQSNAAILRASAGLSGSALIIGMGNAREIPITALANQFDRLTVIDIDKPAITAVVERLDPEIQRKFDLVVDDLGGMTETFERGLQRAAQRSSTLDRYIRDVTRQYRMASPQPYDLEGEQYNFVCSSLVMSQLQAGIGTIAQETARVFYGQRIAPHPRNEEYHLALTDFSRDLSMAHVKMLRSAVASGGMVYFSDTFSQRFVTRSPLTQEVVFASEEGHIVDGEHFSGYIDDNFHLEDYGRWMWYVNPPERAVSAPTTGRAFQVTAMTLSPKS